MTAGALGAVYGDIGASRLYTIKTAIQWAGGAVSPEDALGQFSLIVGTLLIITSIKDVAVIMRADNEGEGGVLALMSLLGQSLFGELRFLSRSLRGAEEFFPHGATPSRHAREEHP